MKAFGSAVSGQSRRFVRLGKQGLGQCPRTVQRNGNGELAFPERYEPYDEGRSTDTDIHGNISGFRGLPPLPGHGGSPLGCALVAEEDVAAAKVALDLGRYNDALGVGDPSALEVARR